MRTLATIWFDDDDDDDDDDDECGAIVAMRIGRGNRSTLENLTQSQFVHNKFNMTWPGLEAGD
jgi:hypothetical protein